MESLAVISRTQTRQSALLQQLPTIRTTVDSVSADLSALKATTGELCATTSSLIGKTDQLARENAELKKSVAALEARVDQLSLAGNVNALSSHRVHTSTLSELTISGLTLGVVSESSLLQLATAISGALAVLTEAKSLLKPAGFKFIWTRNAKGNVEFTNDFPIQLVNSPADLPGIAQLYASQPPGPQRS